MDPIMSRALAFLVEGELEHRQGTEKTKRS